MFSSIGMMIIPNGKRKVMFRTTNQMSSPGLFYVSHTLSYLKPKKNIR